MHYLVRLIVEADDAEEANHQADSMMMDLIEWREFDWYTMQDMESRWKGCWKPMRLSTKKAQETVLAAMQEQLAEFKQTLSAIRFMLDNYSDEQIFNEKFEQTGEHYLSRHQFTKASGYHANVCYLFGEGGDYITDQDHLNGYLENTDRLWVVQVDCHN